MNLEQTRPKFVAVAGNLGVGKSTFVEFICNHGGLKPYFEPNLNNPYLDDFYRDMKYYAFQSQLYFLTSKFRIHQQLLKESVSVLQDRTIYEDAEIFAQNLYRQGYISHRDFSTYWNLYETISASLEPPDLLIYLECSVNTIMKRVKLRNRLSEVGLRKDYVRNLNELYQKWFQEYSHSPTLVINTEKLDYISDIIDRIEILDRIRSIIRSD